METTVRDDQFKKGCRCVSWTAVIAGALVAFSLSVLINLLNAGLGLISFPAFFHALAGVGVGGYIWLIICAIVTMFIAGWVAGAVMQHSANACSGVLHGLLAWSLALLLFVWLGAHVMASAATAAAGHSEASRILGGTIGTNNVAETVPNPSAEALNKSTLGFFILFLLGGASACLGGYVGAKSRSPHRHPRTNP